MSGRRGTPGGRSSACPGRVPRVPGDAGAATGLVLVIVAIAVTVGLSVAVVAAALAARSRAGAAADAAALAAAVAQQDGADTCAAAGQAAAANGSVLTECHPDPRGVTVAVAVPLAAGAVTTLAGPATARSRAGPVPVTPR